MVPHVRYRHPPITHHRKPMGVEKLARPLARATESATQFASLAYHEDAPVLTVKNEQLPRTVEGDLADVPELFPVFAGQGSDPVELLELRLEPAVLGGEVDDLLGVQASRQGEADN